MTIQLTFENLFQLNSAKQQGAVAAADSEVRMRECEIRMQHEAEEKVRHICVYIYTHVYI